MEIPEIRTARRLSKVAAVLAALLIASPAFAEDPFTRGYQDGYARPWQAERVNPGTRYGMGVQDGYSQSQSDWSALARQSGMTDPLAFPGDE